MVHHDGLMKIQGGQEKRRPDYNKCTEDMENRRLEKTWTRQRGPVTPESAKMKVKSRQEMKVSPRIEWKPEASGFGYILNGASNPISALSVGSEWNERHEASYLFSHHHLHRPSDDMKFSKLLPLPKGHPRSRSKAKSDIGSTEDQSEPDLVVPRPTESTPDLRVGISTSPVSSPLIPRDLDQESNGMQTAFFQTIYLTTLSRVPQTAPLSLIDSDLFSNEHKVTT